MSGVVIHVPSGGGAGHPGAGGGNVTLRLGPGQVARFGRGGCTGDGDGVDLRFDDPAVSRLAGEIRATDDHWQLTNHSTTHGYLVENPEGAGEYLRVPPRRVGAPIPFEFARVVLPARGPAVAFQVFAPDHVYLDAGGPGGGGPGTRTLTAYSLDETAAYFLVLVALCEPRLRDESSVAVPTTPQIVERLRDHPVHGGLTARAVTAHLDYLAEEKLRVRLPDAAARRTGKREAVAGVALRFGLVREDHLPLLPARHRGHLLPGVAG
ncbi:serine/threonine protein kinase [Streptomyces sp. CC228A]|uniref:serine/threonine protein kinase n=1 Tax=Streptomyces sp. CC228A TaxID=2898186 RepID=UPI001F2B14C7|nr:serine/threonine protein kinase [Streptomyces sp. CC228A]